MAARNAPKIRLDVFALAREAGLDKAVRQFPEDVAAAAQAAVQARTGCTPCDDVAAEPWPPMRMRKAP